MKRSEERKLQLLLKHYAENGFDHTVEETAQILHVTKKTLFNRYQTKESMETAAMRYWQKYTRDRVEEKCAHANNSAESLLFVICEIMYTKKVTEPLFKRKIHDLIGENQYGNDEIKNLIFNILDIGCKEGTIIEGLNFNAYVPFFLMNVFIYTSQQKMAADVVEFLLSPILTEKGRDMLDEIDIESLLFNQTHLPGL